MWRIELISAIPAAAAVPLSSAAGIVQNTGCAPGRKNRPTASAPVAATGPTTVLTTTATAATARHRLTWPLRSPVRSERREITTSPTIATVYRIAVTKPLPTSLSPEMLSTISPTQHDRPYT